MAGEVTAGLVEVMAAYRRVDDLLTVTCRLTACTPGSAPGPTLGVEYGKPLPLPFTYHVAEGDRCWCRIGQQRDPQSPEKGQRLDTLATSHRHGNNPSWGMPEEEECDEIYVNIQTIRD